MPVNSEHGRAAQQHKSGNQPDQNWEKPSDLAEQSQSPKLVASMKRKSCPFFFFHAPESSNKQRRLCQRKTNRKSEISVNLSFKDRDMTNTKNTH